jgi:hypothetical protein
MHSGRRQIRGCLKLGCKMASEIECKEVWWKFGDSRVATYHDGTRRPSCDFCQWFSCPQNLVHFAIWNSTSREILNKDALRKNKSCEISCPSALHCKVHYSKGSFTDSKKSVPDGNLGLWKRWEPRFRALVLSTHQEAQPYYWASRNILTRAGHQEDLSWGGKCPGGQPQQKLDIQYSQSQWPAQASLPLQQGNVVVTEHATCLFRWFTLSLLHNFFVVKENNGKWVLR